MSKPLTPIEKQWIKRVFGSVGQRVPEGVDPKRAHFIIYWKSVNDARAPFERSAAKQIKQVFERVGAFAKAQYLNTSSITSTVLAVRQTMPSILRTQYRSIYDEVVRSFGGRYQSFVSKADGFDPFSSAAFRAWFDSAIGTRINNISSYTAETIRQIVLEAIDKGLSTEDVANKIQYAAGLSPERATKIATTEVISGSNAGIYFATLENMDSGIKKVWLTTQDNRARESHVEADGQTRSPRSAFRVGESMLMFPGDPSMGADAEELVNCRCTLYFQRAAR